VRQVNNLSEVPLLKMRDIHPLASRGLPIIEREVVHKLIGVLHVIAREAHMRTKILPIIVREIQSLTGVLPIIMGQGRRVSATLREAPQFPGVFPTRLRMVDKLLGDLHFIMPRSLWRMVRVGPGLWGKVVALEVTEDDHDLLVQPHVNRRIYWWNDLKGRRSIQDSSFWLYFECS